MPTGRRKIARSAVRRVKRRESQNAKRTKLKSLRSRKQARHARKYSTAKKNRWNLHEMRGGIKFEMPELLKSNKRKQKEGAEADAAARAEADAATAAAAAAETERLKQKCEPYEQLLNNSLEAIDVIDDMTKYYDDLHLGKIPYYQIEEKRNEIKENWIKTKPTEYIEKTKGLLKQLFITGRKLLDETDPDCRSYLKNKLPEVWRRVIWNNVYDINSAWEKIIPDDNECDQGRENIPRCQ